MINPQTGERELAYVVMIDAINPITGSDNCESASVGGWNIMVRKNTFTVGSLAIFFEIDSHLDTNKPEFSFLASKHGNIKTQKYTFGGKGLMISQGLLMSPKDFGWSEIIQSDSETTYAYIQSDNKIYTVGSFLTKELNVTYATSSDNARKKVSVDKIGQLIQRYPYLFKHNFIKYIASTSFGKKMLWCLLGKRKYSKTQWPDKKFPGVSRTDQERCECMMPRILEDKTPYIVTQKCDGSSATYILERKLFGQFEFYVCSRNVRMAKPDQTCYYGARNYYWEMANKYHIKECMMDYLKNHKDVKFVCWQGEICAPDIQKNPHHLKEAHFYAFHMTDSKIGRFDIRNAKEIWNNYGVEVVPIVDENYIMPDEFEELKLSADGYYDASVCEGNPSCPREGYVYYSTKNPNFSFKNVSREYLLNH